ncbi:MAG: BMP family ABC transporter substrate-binding protein [Deltaproteobacteria bacterium]|nr:BMP family ABC transporter substrate-binding protein [Deltaproteobacteria bacterium]
MKKLRFLAPFLGLLVALSACKKSDSTTESTAENKAAGAPFRVALVLDKGGKDDKSFNASAFLGASRAQKELGIELRDVEVNDDTQVEPTLKNFAKKGYDLVIAIGFTQQEALKKAAEANPNTHFALVDSVVDLPNVASLMFKEHQGSYLAGALAAMKSKSGVIGFIGGMDIPLIRRFELGYREGAKHVKNNIKVIVNYVGVTGEAWNNPTKAKELAVSQMGQKADVIFHAAGASGAGLFDAVEERTKSKAGENFYAIGVDSNQNWVKPGFVLTSMLKRVDVAVFDTIKAAKEGKFKTGRQDFGLQNAGIDLAMDEHNKALVDDWMKTELDKLKTDIVHSKITVTDYYLIKR